MKTVVSALFIIFLVFTGSSARAQGKNKAKNDSLALADSVKKAMFQASLYSMDAVQAKYKSRQPDGKGGITYNAQKAGEAQNLFARSQQCYRHVLELDPKNYKAWCNLGTTYYLEDLPKEAIPYFKTALSFNPYYPPAWLNLGMSYDMLGKTDSAISALRSCIQSDSTYMLGYKELSKVYVKKNDSASALGLLRNAAMHQPGSEVPWTYMASIYFQLNDSAAGIAALETAAKIYPDNVQRLYDLAGYYRAHNNPDKFTFYMEMIEEREKGFRQYEEH